MHFHLSICNFPSIHDAFAAIPQRVTSLSLSRNNLCFIPAAELALAFAAIPQNVTSLDLRANILGLKFAAELAKVFAAIPQSVTSLDLSFNRLNLKSIAELTIIFAGINPSCHVSLQHNLLFSGKNRQEKNRLLTELKNSHLHLDISNNGEPYPSINSSVYSEQKSIKKTLGTQSYARNHNRLFQNPVMMEQQTSPCAHDTSTNITYESGCIVS